MELSQTAALMFAASVAGALLPLYRRWSERGLHVLVSISAGIFLGTIFLTLLPSLAGVESAGHVHAGEAHGEPTTAPWVAALVGLLLLFFVEKVWLRSAAAASGVDPHVGLWIATYVGLGLHALTEGVAFSSVQRDSGVLLATLLIHKATETFSLATVMRLANLGTARVLVFLGLFAAMQPLGLVVGASLAGHGLDRVLTGFACGTFLYVALCDLLPEVFHGVDRPIRKVAAVVFGILLTAITQERLALAGRFLAEVADASLVVFLDLAPYLLVGFLIAGALHQWIRPEWLVRHLARDDLKSVTVAALIGAPLPLCSCSVVPVAVSLRRSGASKGATTAFLIATPETGVDSVTVSWALLDPLLTVMRPVGALVSAIASGAAVNWLVQRGLDRDAPRPASAASGAGAAHAHAHAHDHGHDHDHGHVHAPVAPAREPQTKGEACGPLAVPAADERGRLERILRYAFVEMLDDLAPSLLLSVLISGVIAAAVPAALFESPLAHGFSGLVLMLVVGIPIYVCATASTPIAAALILKGLSPGAALVFLLAGPATNLGSLVLLARQLGRRVILTQLAALAVVLLALGWAVDLAYTALAITPTAALGTASELPGWVTVPSAVVLAALLAVSIARTTLARVAFERSRAGGLAAERS